jgi:two-component system, repressor protein LuxO
MAHGITYSVLLIEDSVSLARVYLEYIRDEPYEVSVADTGKAALDAISRHTYNAILLDLRLPDMDGMDILKELTKRDVKSSVVVITAHGSVNIAVDAMRSGAVDFLLKPFSADRLRITLNNALERFRLREAVDNLEHDFHPDDYYDFIGSSVAMQSVYRMIESAAPSKATTFVTGESGTGKELCAEAIHKKSPRSHSRFVTLNCAAIPKDLMESEIFGHVKGAFTDATSDRDGAATLADGGTLFLDEICEMDLRLQTKLLRFIQTGTIQRVGGSVEEPVDVRFVCATNRDPLKAVASGEFREDLYYRLHVIPIHLPPLRDRGQDILLLSSRLVNDFAKEERKQFVDLDEPTQRAFLNFPWPGNVRQLQNVLRNIVVLNDSDKVTLNMLPQEIADCVDGPVAQDFLVPSAPTQSESYVELPPARVKVIDPHFAPNSTPVPPNHSSPPAQRSQQMLAGPDGIRPLSEIEREAIEDAIARCGGNVPKAAVFLEVSPSTLYRKLQAWEKVAG